MRETQTKKHILLFSAIMAMFLSICVISPIKAQAAFGSASISLSIKDGAGSTLNIKDMTDAQKQAITITITNTTRKTKDTYTLKDLCPANSCASASGIVFCNMHGTEHFTVTVSKTQLKRNDYIYSVQGEVSGESKVVNEFIGSAAWGAKFTQNTSYDIAEGDRIDVDLELTTHTYPSLKYRCAFTNDSAWNYNKLSQSYIYSKAWYQLYKWNGSSYVKVCAVPIGGFEGNSAVDRSYDRIQLEPYAKYKIVEVMPAISGYTRNLVRSFSDSGKVSYGDAVYPISSSSVETLTTNTPYYFTATFDHKYTYSVCSTFKKK